MELQDYWHIVRKSWAMIVAVTLAVMAVVAGYTLTRTPEYRSTTEVYVSVRTGDGTLGEMTQGSGYARQAIDSYVDVVTTSIVTEKVSEEMGGRFTPSQIKTKLSATSPNNTVLIDISANDADPVVAAEVANVTGRVFAEVVANQLEKPTEGSPTRVQIDTVEPAQVPGAPLSPNVSRNMALGLLLGLALGFGIAVLRDVFDTRIRSRRDVAAVTNAPILGQTSFDPEVKIRPLIVQDDPLSPRAEAFRSLRTNLQFLKVEGNPHSFAITSSGPGEGKSTTAANLAITLSEAGSTVCLVDGDLRKPRVAELFGIEGGVGLTDVIIGRARLEDVLQPWGDGQLVLLPSGHKPPNPSELLGSIQMAEMLEILQDGFDYVIVDTPPVLTVTDAAVVSKHVGGALMIAAAGTTRREVLAAAVEDLDHIDARMLGVVLTKVPEKGPDSYYHASYYTYGSSHEGHVEDFKPVTRRGIWKSPANGEPGDGASTIIDSGRR